MNLPNMMISERDKEGYLDDPTSSPLYHLNLDFIRLSCEPIDLVSSQSLLSSYTNFDLLARRIESIFQKGLS